MKVMQFSERDWYTVKGQSQAIALPVSDVDRPLRYKTMLWSSGYAVLL